MSGTCRPSGTRTPYWSPRLLYEIFVQLYRDRADAEHNFDELKNQWGWGGSTTQDLARCRLMARMVALVYNW
ncbi:MAG TPA: transposase [Nitrospira sp.]|nr:transposase [Nitrospira sp.]